MSRGTQQQKQYNILLIGDSCIDRYHYGACKRLSPEAPVPVLSHENTEEMPGMVLNVKNNLLAFAPGVSIDVLTNEERIVKERFVDKRSGQHILRFDSGENKKLSPLSLDLKEIKIIEKYDLVIISDYEKGFVTRDMATRLCEYCSLHDIPIFVDTKKNNLDCFAGSIVKINKKESEELTSIFPANRLVITRGNAGAEWNKNNYPTKSVQVSDVSGAGDTFLAVLAYQYVKLDRNLEKAITLANLAASYVVQKSGTYSLSKGDVDELCL